MEFRFLNFALFLYRECFKEDMQDNLSQAPRPPAEQDPLLGTSLIPMPGQEGQAPLGVIPNQPRIIPIISDETIILKYKTFLVLLLYMYKDMSICFKVIKIPPSSVVFCVYLVQYGLKGNIS
jgi:hypothetical protein